MTTEEDLEKVININNECMDDIQDEDTDHEPTRDLESQGNGDTSTSETYVTMEVEIEVQNQKTDTEAISETPDGTTATISRAQKVFGEAVREGLEEQAKKMKSTSSKKFQKPTLGQNVRLKIPDIDRGKMDPRSIIAIITDIKDEEFYELATKLGKLKALYTRNQFTFCKESF